MIQFWLNELTKLLMLKMGYRLLKSPQVYWKKNSANCLVEVVGAPASGKTTALRSFYQKNQPGIQRIRPRLHLDQRVFRGAVDPCQLEIISEFAQLARSGVRLCAGRKISYSDFEMLIFRLHQSTHYLKMGGMVLEEEGLFKTFPETMLSYLNSRALARSAFLERRAFVVFEARPEFQANMFRRRKISQLRPGEARRDFEKEFERGLPERIKKYSSSLAVWADLKEHLNECGTPYIVVNPEQGISDNAEEITEFIERLS